MNRKYETEIKIKPIKWNTTDDIDTDDDTDEITVRSTYMFYMNFTYLHQHLVSLQLEPLINVFFQDDDIDFDSALETFDRIGSFDISEISVKEPHFIKDVMHFDKHAFYYWLDDGVVEIALEMGQNLTGTWRTMDESATGKN